MTLSSFLAERGMSQSDFARLIGVKRQSVFRYVNGHVPTPDVMKRIVDVTNGDVRPNDFFDIKVAA